MKEDAVGSGSNGSLTSSSRSLDQLSPSFANGPYLDVMTANRMKNMTEIGQLPGQTHSLLLLEPLVFTDLGHAGIVPKVKADDVRLFCPDGKKSKVLSATIHEAYACAVMKEGTDEQISPKTSTLISASASMSPEKAKNSVSSRSRTSKGAGNKHKVGHGNKQKDVKGGGVMTEEAHILIERAKKRAVMDKNLSSIIKSIKLTDQHLVDSVPKT